MQPASALNAAGIHSNKSIDLIMIDPSVALIEKLDEFIWTVCFYEEFKKLKDKPPLVCLIYLYSN